MVQVAHIDMAQDGQPLAAAWHQGRIPGMAGDVLRGLGAVPSSGQGRDLNGLLGCAVALLVAAGLLVSCTERPPVLPAAAPPPTVALTPPDLAPPPVPVTPVPRTKPKPPPQIVPAAVVPPQRPAEPAADDARARPTESAGTMDPGVLVGMTESETLQLLGQPAWTQEIPPAKTWQYASDRCVLRVFMFMEMTTQDFRTLSYELTSTDEQPDVDQQCLAELVAQAWGAGTHTDDAARPHRTGG